MAACIRVQGLEGGNRQWLLLGAAVALSVLLHAQVPQRHRVAVHGERVPVLQLQRGDAELRRVPSQRRGVRPRDEDQLHEHVRRADGRHLHGDEEARVRRWGGDRRRRGGVAGQVGVGLEEARDFIAGVIRVCSGGKGTPMMPGRRFETYVFSLFELLCLF